MIETRVIELWNRAVEEVGDATYPKIIYRFAELVSDDENAKLRARVAELEQETRTIFGAEVAQIEAPWRSRVAELEAEKARLIAGEVTVRTGDMSRRLVRVWVEAPADEEGA